MNPQEIFRLLKAGNIGPDVAKKQLLSFAEKKEQSTEGNHPSEKRPNNVDIEQRHKVDTVRPKPEKDLDNRIAIIGMSGRYPDAGQLDQYWSNLEQGLNSIREIPQSRWDINAYYDPEPGKKDKTYCKSLGALDNIESFDSLFFSISPAEAELMDPQHRIFIEESYKAFEDAGYTKKTLDNANCGVYFGIMSGEYGKALHKSGFGGEDVTGDSYAIGSARIPYYLNLKGPAIPLDTACSSSLVGTHLACQALKNEEIDMALVGGVTLYLTPEIYIGMCGARMLSPEGQCKAFDNKANGFVPGEGAGSIVLKRLADAERDGDHIYGLIIGSGINQDGKSNGITAPNLGSQIALEREVYEKNNIDPGSISYVEMHGTGTKLGDPIELEALSTVFKEKTTKKRYCAIGSVKSNIGHISAAAGVAGIHKVMKAMQHQKLVPSLNFEEPNEHFDFADSPFYVNTELKDWNHTSKQPRRAAVSSFGYSGTNAHLVLEEYLPKEKAIAPPHKIEKPLLFVLSAQTDEQLLEYAEKMVGHLSSTTEMDLMDLTYTSQLGRDAMTSRLAIVASSKEDIIKKLSAFIHGKPMEGSYKGNRKKDKKKVADFKENGEADRLLEGWLKTRDYNPLGELWAYGLEVDWELGYTDTVRPKRMSLPTYPFSKEKHWKSINTKLFGSDPSAFHNVSSSQHPLLHKNVSGIGGICFDSTFSAQHPLVQENTQGPASMDQSVLYPEMAISALYEASNQNRHFYFKDLLWGKPTPTNGEEVKLKTKIFLEENHNVACEVTKVSDEKEVVCYQNRAVETEKTVPEKVDLKVLRKGFSEKTITKEALNGTGTLPPHTEKIYWDQDKVLVDVMLPPTSQEEGRHKFYLHPIALRAAIHSLKWIAQIEEDACPIPVSAERVEVFAACTSSVCLLLHYDVQDGTSGNNGHKIDIDIYNDQGDKTLQIKGLKLIIPDSTSQADEATMDVYHWKPIWKESISAEPTEVMDTTRREVLLLGQEEGLLHTFRETILASNIAHVHIICTARIAIEQVFTEVYGYIRRSLKELSGSSVLLQVGMPIQHDSDTMYTALAGMLRTAHLENPRFMFQLIEMDLKDNKPEEVAKILNKSSTQLFNNHIRYENATGYEKQWEKLSNKREPFPVAKATLPWKDGGVYLITGGLGGLGVTFTSEIVRHTQKATIILTGRSPLTSSKQYLLDTITIKNAHVEYYQVDVNNEGEVRTLFTTITEKYGSLSGIVHGAGVKKDNYILHKEQEEFVEVLSPKIVGTLNVDKCSQHMALDFFLMFSSIAGAIGNLGQADYATGNAFMDSFAPYRNRLVDQGQRQGHTLSINWPLWAEGGGMLIDEATAEILLEDGIVALTLPEGLDAFYRAYASGESQVLVLKGRLDKLSQFMASKNNGSVKQVSTHPEPTQNNDEELREKTLQQLKELFGSVVKMPASAFDAEEHFEHYGIDSIMVTKLNHRLSTIFRELSKTVFYECLSFQSLADYLIKAHYDECIQWVGLEMEQGNASKNVTVQQEGERTHFPELPSFKSQKGGVHFANSLHRHPETGSREPMAIIGMSGRYPQARNLNDYWENLKSGKDCIIEIPEDRWDIAGFFEPDRQRAGDQGKSYSKWGGFIEGHTEFDPLFFNISPGDTMNIDPQERLFMMACWEAMEDAGYTKERLRTAHSGRVGVFAGITKTGFELYGADGTIDDNDFRPRTSFGSLVNRVSYFLNLNGPSIPVDTMCSSSLTAIHLACESLYRGECEMVIAGGVNLYLHESSYTGLSGLQMLSPKGRCSSFGEGGDGFVPGEGVGTVILKPLSKALEDNDNIQALIRGTNTNHGGKTNGYTVPNPNAQAELIRDTLDRAGVDARTVSYVEAHGTGTSLGDPIEITGLKLAYEKDTEEKQYCAIGSVKSNIGHLEAAAGIAGLTKIVLQMKHGQLVPSLHAQSLNANINFEKTPFKLQQGISSWEKPTIIKEGKEWECPRIASLSSFGAGGANAHIIVEEYENKIAPQLSVSKDNPAIIVLSALDYSALIRKADQLMDWIANETFSETDLMRMAYTLQVGREAMEDRLAMIVSSRNDLEQKLHAFITGKKGEEGVFIGNRQKSKEFQSLFNTDTELMEAFDKWILKKKYDKLLPLWVSGISFDWKKLYPETPRMISLPAYPFAKEKYWPKVSDRPKKNRNTGIHPLLHSNTSDFFSQRFTSEFSGDEFFLAGHVVNGKKVLPGVAYIEMAITAAKLAMGENVDNPNLSLSNVAWAQPIVMDDGKKQVNIELLPDEAGLIHYEIYTEDEEGIKLTHSSGDLLNGDAPDKAVLDIEAIKKRCDHRIIGKADCYRLFTALGMEYGEGHQAVEAIYVGDGEAVSKLRLPASLGRSFSDFTLHPSLMDAAFQSLLGLVAEGQAELLLPFAIDSLKIYGKCTQDMWAYIRNCSDSIEKNDTRKVDIDLCDAQGSVCVKIQGLTSRVLQTPMMEENEEGQVLLYPVWQEKPHNSTLQSQAYAFHKVILCGLSPSTGEELVALMEGTDIVNLAINDTDKDIEYQYFAENVFTEVKKLMARRFNGNSMVQIVVPADRPWLKGLSGLIKVAHQENPGFYSQLIIVPKVEAPIPLSVKLYDNCSYLDNIQVSYQNTKREVLCWQELSNDTEELAPSLWKEGHVYLITGGAGGIGRLIANDIISNSSGITVVLTGRSVLSETATEQLEKQLPNGSGIVYYQADVSDKGMVQGLLKYIEAEHGHLKGIIHGAGVIRDNFILKKNIRELNAVMKPKVRGLHVLDQESKHLGLDFFVMFSAGAAVLGNIGQADYAMGNAFMDSYAQYRNELVEKNQRNGYTLSINWPLWKEGGMKIDTSFEKAIEQNTGMKAIKTDKGINAFYKSLSTGKTQIIVLEGNLTRIRKLLLYKQELETQRKNRIEQGETKPAATHHRMAEDIEEKTIDYMKRLFSKPLKLAENRIQPDTEFERYGIDSIKIIKMTGLLEEKFGSLPKTLFFEYQSLRELSRYFIDRYHDKLNSLMDLNGDADLPEGRVTDNGTTRSETERHRTNGEFTNRFMPTPKVKTAISEKQRTEKEDIAIIGLSGQYPQSEDIHEFWKNLEQGKDCITEIPSDRWDHDDYYAPDKDAKGKIYTKWGGFLKDIKAFDPLFFNISPRDAKTMDPQERLFMQSAYETMEDAGYTRTTLSKSGNVGVYVGVMYGDYQLYGVEETMRGNALAISSNPASIANRVSYFCNFHGPSIALDTMCSSSLTTLHLACQSLQLGECEVALAGGVNASVHPNKYLLLSQGKFASSKGRCESFGEGGDGYVPGEGVGAVLLKPLSRAIADGDHIYGVVKGSAINHGGKTNGYTMPNPKAQAAVIERAFENSNVDPRTISYIEAHGTGTSLGDPIEIAGLQKAFEKYTKDKQFCVIGSSKSNIGHCESAAGIGGITKVLLQMQYRKLVPSLHSDILNPNINFEESPFVVQQNLSEWKRPKLNIKGQEKEYPRIAGISSFGAGGANAHVIIEEYVPPVEQPTATPPVTQEHAILLSAKNKVRLGEKVAQLEKALNRDVYTTESLSAVAYTLQIGRESMAERLGFVVRSKEELLAQLKRYLQGGDSENLWRGSFDEGAGHDLPLDNGAALTTAQLAQYIADKDLKSLIKYWVGGQDIDWAKLYKGTEPKRISLPTYPFAKDHYWIPAKERPTSTPAIESLDKPKTKLASADDGNSSSEEMTKELLEKASGIQQIQLKDVLDTLPKEEKDHRTGSNGVKPLNTEGGHQRSQSEPLRVSKRKSTTKGTSNKLSKSTVQQELKKDLSMLLQMNENDIGPDTAFIDLGLDSIVAMEWVKQINARYDILLKATKIYDYPNISELSVFIHEELPATVADNLSTLLESSFDECLEDQIEILPTTEVVPISHQSEVAVASGASVREEAKTRVSRQEVQEDLKQGLAELLQITGSDIGLDTQFIDLGLDSIVSMEWVKQINSTYTIKIKATKIYDYSNIRKLSTYIETLMSTIEKETTEKVSSGALDDILKLVQKGELDALQAEKMMQDEDTEEKKLSKEAIFKLIANEVIQIIPELEGHDFHSSDELKLLGANSVDRSEIVLNVLRVLELNIPIIETFGAQNLGELTTLLYEKL